MIDQNTIERIQDTAQIVDVVSDFVTLRRRGVNYVGLCPFHEDRTPSFYVSPAKNICKCFACGEGGSAVHFIMKHEQLSYSDALKFLAKKYNIEIFERELTSEEKQAESNRDSMFILNQFANEYFINTLHNTAEGKSIGMSYFKERGFREDIIKKFQLGYALEEKNSFSNEAQKGGFKVDFLLKTGLSSGGENGKPIVDRFRGRVIFPVHTISGRVVAFGGRILKKAENTGKYVNSPESEIYSKSRELYGIYFAKNAIMKAEKCFLVEGYTDVISMHQAGIENVVSSSGTALTHGQIVMIRRFSENITVLYDGDSAGIKAALRGIDLLLEHGMNIKVVLLPEGEDPDSFARKQNAESFNLFISQHEQDFIRFKTNILLQEAANDPIKKAAVINNIIESIALIPDNIKRSVYIQDTANVLNAREEIIIRAVNKLRMKSFEKQKEQMEKNIAGESNMTNSNTTVAINLANNKQLQYTKKADSQNTNPFDKLEREIIRYIVRYGQKTLFVKYEKQKRKGSSIEEEIAIEDGPSVTEFIVSDLEQDKIEFTNSLYAMFYNEARAQIDNNEFIPYKYFLAHPNPEINKLAADLISDKYHLSKIHAKAIGEKEDDRSSRLRERNSLDKLVPRATTELKNMHVMQRINIVKQHIKKSKNDDEIDALMDELIRLQELKMAISKYLGERIILKF